MATVRIDGVGVLTGPDIWRADYWGRVAEEMADAAVVVLPCVTDAEGNYLWDFAPDNPNAVAVVRQRPGESMGDARRRGERLAGVRSPGPTA